MDISPLVFHQQGITEFVNHAIKKIDDLEKDKVNLNLRIGCIDAVNKSLIEEIDLLKMHHSQLSEYVASQQKEHDESMLFYESRIENLIVRYNDLENINKLQVDEIKYKESLYEELSQKVAVDENRHQDELNHFKLELKSIRIHLNNIEENQVNIKQHDEECILDLINMLTTVNYQCDKLREKLQEQDLLLEKLHENIKETNDLNESLSDEIDQVHKSRDNRECELNKLCKKLYSDREKACSNLVDSLKQRKTLEKENASLKTQLDEISLFLHYQIS